MKHFHLVFVCLLLPLLAYAYEPAIDFEVLKKNYQEGQYDHILQENDFLYRSWLEKGYFDDYIVNRRDSIKLAMQKFRLAKEVQEKNQAKLDRIEKNKRRALFTIAKQYPNLRISQVVKNILQYDELSQQHKNAVEYMAFLEFGVIDISRDPAAAPIQQMMFDYMLRNLVVSSLLIDGKIGPETAHIYQAVIEMDKEHRLRELCLQYQDSYAASKCLEAMDVTAAMIPVAYDKKYLGDLLVGMRAPENEAEDKVCRVLKDAYSRRMEFFGIR
jgi:hypothetical protein